MSTPPPPTQAQTLIAQAKQVSSKYNELKTVHDTELQNALKQVSADRTGAELPPPTTTSSTPPPPGYKQLETAYGKIHGGIQGAVNIKSIYTDDKYKLKDSSVLDPAHKAGEFIGSNISWLLNGPPDYPEGYTKFSPPDPDEVEFTSKIAGQLDSNTKVLIKNLETERDRLEAEAKKDASLKAANTVVINELNAEIDSLKKVKFKKVVDDTDREVGHADEHFLRREHQAMLNNWVNVWRHSEKTGHSTLFNHGVFHAKVTNKIDEDGKHTVGAEVKGIPFNSFFGSNEGVLHAMGHFEGSYYEGLIARGKPVMIDKLEGGKPIPDPKNPGKNIQEQEKDSVTGKLKYEKYTEEEALNIVRDNPFPLDKLPSAFPHDTFVCLMDALAIAKANGGTIEGYDPTNPAFSATGGFDPAMIKHWAADFGEDASDFEGLMTAANVTNGLAAAEARVQKHIVAKQFDAMEASIKSAKDPYFRAGKGRTAVILDKIKRWTGIGKPFSKTAPPSNEEIKEEINQAKKEYQKAFDAAQQAEPELRTAKTAITDAEKEITDAEKDIKDAEAEDKKADTDILEADNEEKAADIEIAAAKTELADAEKRFQDAKTAIATNASGTPEHIKATADQTQAQLDVAMAKNKQQTAENKKTDATNKKADATTSKATAATKKTDATAKKTAATTKKDDAVVQRDNAKTIVEKYARWRQIIIEGRYRTIETSKEEAKAGLAAHVGTGPAAAAAGVSLGSGAAPVVDIDDPLAPPTSALSSTMGGAGAGLPTSKSTITSSGAAGGAGGPALAAASGGTPPTSTITGAGAGGTTPPTTSSGGGTTPPISAATTMADKLKAQQQDNILKAARAVALDPAQAHIVHFHLTGEWDAAKGTPPATRAPNAYTKALMENDFSKNAYHDHLAELDKKASTTGPSKDNIEKGKAILTAIENDAKKVKHLTIT